MLSIILIDSKQIVNGSAQLATGAGKQIQLTDAWVTEVINKLGPSSPAAQAVQNALDNGTLVKAVGGVNRSTGTVILVPVK